MKYFPIPLAYLSIFLLCGFLTIPPFLNDYIVGHDLLYHLNWNEQFQTQLFQGDLYPRWLFDMKGGRGSPVFYFYSPLPYYCAALFSILIPTAQSTWYSLGAACCFALIVSAFGMFWFIRPYAGDKYAYIYTIFYILFPYYIVVDLYTRFAFTEFFAIAWIPYIFIFIRKLTEGVRSALWLLSIFYALLILSNIPTTLLITPLAILFGLINANSLSQKIRIIGGFAYGILICTFYILPILSMKNLVSIEKMTTGNFIYNNFFLFDKSCFFSYESSLNSFLEKLLIISIITNITIYFSIKIRNNNFIFYIISCLISIFMMLPTSNFIWKSVNILHIVQFPWRFYILISFTLFWGACQSDLGDRGTKFHLARYCSYMTIFMLISASTVTIYNSYYRSTQKNNSKYNQLIKRSLSIHEGAQEYLPATTPAIYYDQVNNLTLERVESMFKGTKYNVKNNYSIKGDQIIAQVDNRHPQVVIFNQFYFPTWEVKNLDTGQTLNLKKSDEGFIELLLDKGVFNLKFTHKFTSSEILGLMISSSMIFIICLRLLLIYKKGNFFYEF